VEILGNPISVMRFLLPALLLPLLAACTALPSQGPGMSKIVAHAGDEKPRYDVIRLDSGIADRVSVDRGSRLGSTFGMSGGAADLRIRVGDVVSITIYEAASGGLFSGEVGSAAKSVNLPSQPVARNGMISVPYVGQVRVLDRRPPKCRRASKRA
jgi:polysaccharide export outer membrane protein